MWTEASVTDCADSDYFCGLKLVWLTVQILRPVNFMKTTKKTYKFWGKLRQYENGTKVRNSEAKNYGNQNASLVDRNKDGFARYPFRPF